MLTHLLAAGGDWALFAGRAIRNIFRPPDEVHETLRHLFDLGCRSVPLIAASGFAVGVVLSMHTRASLARFGAEALIPAGLAIALVRETGPLTAGLLLSGRIGAGIGAELERDEGDRADRCARGPGRRLVQLPRGHAGGGMHDRAPILTTVMNFSGIWAAFAAETAITGVRSACTSASVLADSVLRLVPATLKTIVFGFIIATTSRATSASTHSGGTEGVGQASTRSVVLSSDRCSSHQRPARQNHFFLFPGQLCTRGTQRSSLDRVTKSFGRPPVLDDVSLTVALRAAACAFSDGAAPGRASR